MSNSNADSNADSNAEAVIEGNQIVIRLDIENITMAVEGGIEMGTIMPGATIVDPYVFAKEVVHALNDEDEEGTTMIHMMFDQAFEDALDGGSEGVEYDEGLEIDLANEELDEDE